MVNQLNAKHADAAAVAELLAKPEVVDQNQAVLAMQSADTIDRERASSASTRHDMPSSLRTSIPRTMRHWSSMKMMPEAQGGSSGARAIDLFV